MKFVLFFVSVLPLLVFQYFRMPLLVVLGYTIVPVFMAWLWIGSLKKKAVSMDKRSQAETYLSKRTWGCGIVSTVLIYGLAFVDPYDYSFASYYLTTWNLYALLVVFLFATLATFGLRHALSYETKRDRITAPISQIGLRMIFLSIPLGIVIAFAVDKPGDFFASIAGVFVVGVMLNKVFAALTKDKSQFVKSEVMEAINNGAARGAKSYLDAQKTNNQRRLREFESRFATGGTLTESEQAEYNSLRGRVG